MFPKSSAIQVCGALAKRRPLGGTGMQVSPMALGTMQFGWTASDLQSMQILDAYAAAGGNLIDTANMYGGDQSIESFEPNKTRVGTSEAIIGRWLNTRKCRHKMILTTKVRARMWDGPDGEGLTRNHIVRAVDDSLRRLCTDHIDVLYAHWPDPSAVAEEWLETFGDLIRHGKVGAAGTSNFCRFESFGDLLTPLMHLAASDSRYPKIQVEQPRFILLHRSEYESALQGIAADEHLGIVTYSSLASGFLAGAVALRQTPSGSRAKFLGQYCVETVGDCSRGCSGSRRIGTYPWLRCHWRGSMLNPALAPQSLDRTGRSVGRGVLRTRAHAFPGGDRFPRPTVLAGFQARIR